MSDQARELLAAEISDAVAEAIGRYAVAYSHETLTDVSTANRTWAVHETGHGNPFEHDVWLGKFDNKAEADALAIDLRRAAGIEAVVSRLDAALALRSESEAAWVAGELAGRQSLAHSEQAAHKAAIGQKERAEKAEALADKYKWQVRDTCVRAEKAEARTLAAEQDLAGAREAALREAAAIAEKWRDENRLAAAKCRKRDNGMAEMLDGAAIECNAIMGAILNLTKDATDD